MHGSPEYVLPKDRHPPVSLEGIKTYCTGCDINYVVWGQELQAEEESQEL